jgi:pyruvate kinase
MESMPIKRTKIIATLGPATEKAGTIKELIDNGVDFFRFNMKYNTEKWHGDEIKIIRKIGKKMKIKPGIIVDIPRVDFAISLPDFDYIALSYLKSAKEIVDLKERFKRKYQKEIKVIAKIENQKALDNIESIIDEAEAIMVARGDLARSVNFYELAYFQKTIIDKCRIKQKPVIVATEMLLSMTNNPEPTRAEATDVANAVFDGTDVLMLSQETTIGKYPVETVKTMSEITIFSENANELRQVVIPSRNLEEEIIKAATRLTAENINKIKAVVVFTRSGRTATKISASRLKIPVVAISDNPEVITLLNLSYGVIPYFKNFSNDKFSKEGNIFKELMADFKWTKGDNVVIVHGDNWLQSGSTNNISLKTI